MNGRVHQEDETKLKATVTQAEKDRTVTGDVSISGDLDSSNPETDDNTIASGGTRETPIALLYGYEPNEGAWKRIRLSEDAPGHLFVASANPADLKATVTPSGDMARKALYDRTSELIHKYWSGYESTHGVTVRWTYTVPDGRKAIHTFLSGIMFIDIATADKVCEQTWEILKAGGAFTPVVQQLFIGTDGYLSQLINNASFTLFAEDGIRGVTVNGDTTGHVFSSSSVLTEFDE